MNKQWSAEKDKAIGLSDQEPLVKPTVISPLSSTDSEDIEDSDHD